MPSFYALDILPSFVSLRWLRVYLRTSLTGEGILNETPPLNALDQYAQPS